MDRSHLETVFDDLEIKTVEIYIRSDSGKLLITEGLVCENSEQQPIDTAEELMFSKISHDVERCIWFLHVPLFKRLDGMKLSPSTVVISQGSLVREQNGKEWMLVRPAKKCAGTQWRCPSLEWLGDSMIKG